MLSVTARLKGFWLLLLSGQGSFSTPNSCSPPVPYLEHAPFSHVQQLIPGIF